MRICKRNHSVAQSVVVILVGLVHLALAGCVVGQDASDNEPSEPILVAEFPDNRSVSIDPDGDGLDDMWFESNYAIGLSEGSQGVGATTVFFGSRDSTEVLQKVQKWPHRTICQDAVVLSRETEVRSIAGKNRCWGEHYRDIFAFNQNIENPDVEWEFEYEPRKPFLIGVRVKKMTQYHYGWVQLLLEPIQSHSKLRVTVLDAFIHPEPNTGVRAGKDEG